MRSCSVANEAVLPPLWGWAGRILIGIELDAAAVFGLLARRIAVHLGNVGTFVLAHALSSSRVFDGEAPASGVSAFSVVGSASCDSSASS